MVEHLLPTPMEISAECHCLNLQRAARAVARRYDAALRPAGLTSGQFAILAGLSGDAPLTLTALAALLGLERTTLTRNLMPLAARGLIETGHDDGDQRARPPRLTGAGRRLLAEAAPRWRDAQAASAAALASPWPPTRAALDRLRAV